VQDAVLGVRTLRGVPPIAAKVVRRGSECSKNNAGLSVYREKFSGSEGRDAWRVREIDAGGARGTGYSQGDQIEFTVPQSCHIEENAAAHVSRVGSDGRVLEIVVDTPGQYWMPTKTLEYVEVQQAGIYKLYEGDTGRFKDALESGNYGIIVLERVCKDYDVTVELQNE
jgi:hypothetical protein